MNNIISKGVYPTMLTPFTNEGRVDYVALEQLIEWYIKNGVDGVFAVCQSSEMFYLTDEEKLEILKFVVKTVNGRVSVVTSGHTDPNIDKAIEQMKRIEYEGADALVFISNLLATEKMDGDIFKKNAEKVMNEIKSIPLGVYECPFPFKYVLPLEIVDWCAKSDRFLFVKDTCCDIEMIKQRIDVMKNTQMMLFNANTATILESFRYGCHGYSGVMANFFPKVYKWLYENANDNRADAIGELLTASALVEYVSYPKCAKYYLKKHIEISDFVRKPDQIITSANAKDIQSVSFLVDNLAAKIIERKQILV